MTFVKFSARIYPYTSKTYLAIGCHMRLESLHKYLQRLFLKLQIASAKSKKKNIVISIFPHELENPLINLFSTV